MRFQQPSEVVPAKIWISSCLSHYEDNQ